MGEIEFKRMNVTQFLRQYESKNTTKNYHVALNQFFTLMYPDGGDIDALSERYLSEDRDYRQDFLTFRDSLHGKAPMTKAIRFNIVRTFLNDNGITFPDRFFKNLNGKVTEPVTDETIPTNEELKRICEYLPIYGKALALVLASSGMRVGEAVTLRIDDVELDLEPAKLHLRGENTKTGKRRITFITPEATDVVKEWLTYRDQYLKQATGRSATYDKAKDRERLFPFTSANFNAIWNTALEKAGLHDVDERTRRVKMRPHNLRKFFRLRIGRFGQDEAEALIGHQRGLNAVYARFEGPAGEQRLEQIYKQAIPDLAIYGRTLIQQHADREVQSRLAENQTTIAVLATQMASVQAENLRLREELTALRGRLETELTDLKRAVQALAA